ncbi:hypothetical protein BCAR13_1470019 [Paraburkholderia caribensis]|nr:hypothetical protein BCAR13_1470019 [Paraburkholderia caribensis]
MDNFRKSRITTLKNHRFLALAESVGGFQSGMTAYDGCLLRNPFTVDVEDFQSERS